jgi:hypothetical protein
MTKNIYAEFVNIMSRVRHKYFSGQLLEKCDFILCRRDGFLQNAEILY